MQGPADDYTCHGSDHNHRLPIAGETRLSTLFQAKKHSLFSYHDDDDVVEQHSTRTQVLNIGSLSGRVVRNSKLETRTPCTVPDDLSHQASSTTSPHQETAELVDSRPRALSTEGFRETLIKAGYRLVFFKGVRSVGLGLLQASNELPIFLASHRHSHRVHRRGARSGISLPHTHTKNHTKQIRYRTLLTHASGERNKSINKKNNTARSRALRLTQAE